jgi:hypothetical protein
MRADSLIAEYQGVKSIKESDPLILLIYLPLCRASSITI